MEWQVYGSAVRSVQKVAAYVAEVFASMSLNTALSTQNPPFVPDWTTALDVVFYKWRLIGEQDERSETEPCEL